MMRVRTVRDLDDFAGAPDDPVGYRDQLSELWQSGRSGPEMCFVIEAGTERLGRVGFRTTPTADSQWLGSLPPEELFVFGLALPWTADFLSPGKQLMRESLASIASSVSPTILEVRLNAEAHSHVEERRALLEGIGMSLFQEKQGYFWVDDGSAVEVPQRLRFATLAEQGAAAYRTIMAQCGEGTMDRNDRYYWGGCGPDNWAGQMMSAAHEEDAEMWLLGIRDGDPVGYVAVMSDDEWGSTIAHIGVTPDHRGNGYINDLLAAGTAAAQRAGISTMLSDVDVLNEPMRRAMVRAGHTDDRRPWHVWVYRGEVAVLAAS